MKISRDNLKYYSEKSYIGSPLRNAHFMAKEKMIYLVEQSRELFTGPVEEKQRDLIMEAVNEPRESVLAKIEESKRLREDIR
jgi:hypothetical protein